MSIFDGVLGLLRSGNDPRTEGYNEALREVHQRMKNQVPLAWCWYDNVNERYEFALREEDAPESAQPLYRRYTRVEQDAAAIRSRETEND